MSKKEDVITHTYDLLLYIVPHLGKYPKTHKFLLADRIYGNLLDILEHLIQAYYTSSTEKRSFLIYVNTKLEQTRYLVRLSKDLHCISIKRYGLISEKMDIVGRQVGGWLKALPKA